MVFSKAAKLKAQMAPAGVGGLKLSSGKVEEEFLDELQWPEAGKVYQEMSSNDAVVGGCLYLIETMARRASWHVKPASQEAGDIEAAEFLESCMHDMKGQPWDSFYLRCAVDAHLWLQLPRNRVQDTAWSSGAGCEVLVQVH